MKNCLILGSNSDIGQALAYKFAAAGFNIILASRNCNEYQIRLQNDISIKHKTAVSIVQFDGSDINSHQVFWDNLETMPDLVISVFGFLGNQDEAMDNQEEMYRIIVSNYLGQISLINNFIKKIRGTKKATIIGISSVAGERGRKSNYIYGSAKAGFTTYLSGLRNDLFKDEIHVMTVIPGFVKTKMLGDLKTPKILTATPEETANKIYSGFSKRKNIIYVYPIWRYVMFIIKIIPEFIFKKMNL
jgi:decaprenylphospho-beta-D-erythro-pentofuranosid-2-ulose 2-reductase